ncbi:MAG: glycosyltransferase family 39 protein [Thermodesulfovibrionia bacterium]|nr:glycosyltransferase family 39 protein [Thermodesulfovibrionia bacterium]
MVDHVLRILNGQKLYTSPSIEFVASIYAPLYFYVAAAISKITGIGFFPLRLVSFISSLGSFITIYLIVKRETTSSFAGVLASCLFAATFQISSSWFDIARVDNLFLFLLLIALYLIRFRNSSGSLVLAGVFISLSFLTKQTALLIALPMMLYSFLRDRRSANFFIFSSLLLMGGSTLILNYIHKGWYNFYLFDLPKQHPMDMGMLTTFWTQDILSHLSIAFIMGLVYLLTLLFSCDKETIFFYFLMAASMIGASWGSRIHVGGAENVLLPAYAAISILFGLAFHTVSQFITAISTNKRNLLMASFLLLCTFQFYLLKYNPMRQIPTEEDLEAGRKFINIMSQIKGELFMPEHGYLPTLAGKNGYAFSMSINDVIRSNAIEVKGTLLAEIRQNIQERRYASVILSDFEPFQKDYIEQYYKVERKIFDSEDVFYPVAGLKRRPEYIYVPKNSVPIEINNDFLK